MLKTPLYTLYTSNYTLSIFHPQEDPRFFSNSHYGKFASISLVLLRIGAIENLEKPITSLKIFSLGNLWAT